MGTLLLLGDRPEDTSSSYVHQRIYHAVIKAVGHDLHCVKISYNLKVEARGAWVLVAMSVIEGVAGQLQRCVKISDVAGFLAAK